MQVIVARHGHTFGPDQIGGQCEILCGVHQNLPLVQRGRDKARQLAVYLANNQLTPSVIYSNYLLRTWEHACIVRDYFYNTHEQDIPLLLDDSLIELDYGAWAGLETSKDNNQVIAQFGQVAWDAWQTERKVPTGAPHNWQESSESIIQRVTAFFEMLQEHAEPDTTILALASQGTLTFIHSLFKDGMAQACAKQQLKTAPGNFCHLTINEKGKWQLLAWNKAPE